MVQGVGAPVAVSHDAVACDARCRLVGAVPLEHHGQGLCQDV